MQLQLPVCNLADLTLQISKLVMQWDLLHRRIVAKISARVFIPAKRKLQLQVRTGEEIRGCTILRILYAR